jgi:hypothetical protein
VSLTAFEQEGTAYRELDASDITGRAGGSISCWTPGMTPKTNRTDPQWTFDP